jgi:hypothetical protein
MLIALEVPVSPRLSVAFAVRLYDPAATLLHVKEYGVVVSSPSFVVPWKNSTFATDPLSEALAVIVMLAGAANDALFAGAVMLAVGGVLAAVTVMLTALDAPVPPALSVATALRLYVPAFTLLQLKLYGLVLSLPSSVVPL